MQLGNYLLFFKMGVVTTFTCKLNTFLFECLKKPVLEKKTLFLKGLYLWVEYHFQGVKQQQKNRLTEFSVFV